MSKKLIVKELKEEAEAKAKEKLEKEKASNEDALKKLLEKIGCLQKSFEDNMKAHTERVDGIDARLVKVEELVGIKKLTEENSDPKKENGSTDASNPVKKDEGETREKDEGEAKVKKEATNGGASEESESTTEGCTCIWKVFTYRDPYTGYVYIVDDRWAAKQAGHGEYDEVWALYKNGQIDHILSPEEIRETFVRC